MVRLARPRRSPGGEPEASLRTPAAPPASAATAPCPSASSTTWRARRSGSAKPSRASSLSQNVADRWTRRCARPARGCRKSRPTRSTCGCSSSSSSSPLGKSVQLRDIVERGCARGKQMRLRVVDHLHAMLDRPQQPVGLGQLARPSPRPAARRREAPRSRRAWRRRADRSVAAAVDHLLDLDEELDLADAAAAALEVEAGPDRRALAEMVADPRGDLAHLLDHSEIERAPPDERLDRRRGTAARARYRRPPHAPG